MLAEGPENPGKPKARPTTVTMASWRTSYRSVNHPLGAITPYWRAFYSSKLDDLLDKRSGRWVGVRACRPCLGVLSISGVFCEQGLPLFSGTVRVPIFRVAKNGRVAQQPEMDKMPMAVALTPTHLPLRVSRKPKLVRSRFQGNQSSRNSATGGLETTLRQLYTPRQPMRTMPEPMPTGHTQGDGE